MAQTSFPFENVDTTETQFSQMFRTLNAGVNGTPAGTELKVTAGTGLAVSIAAGQAMVRGHYYISTAAETLALTAANGSNPRIDAIVLTLDPTANTIVLAKVDGTPASSPVAPTLTQTDAGVFQYLLATVLVPAAATVPSTITDTRGFMGSRFGLWATAGRPSAPILGQVGFNTTLNAAESWNGSAWVLVGAAPNANAIANGDFSKWTRGTTFTNPLNGSIAADRWQVTYDGSGATRTVSQQVFTPGAAPIAGYEGSYFIRNSLSAVGTGNNFNGLQHTIDDVRTFAGQTVTYSFWAKAASATTITPYVLQNFGTGGSSQNSVSVSGISITTSWTRYSFSYAMSSVSGKTINANNWLGFWLTWGNTVNAIDIWGVQIEQGTVASDFKPAGGNKALDTVTSGSAGFDGVLVSTGSASNFSGSGTPAWAGFDVAGKNKIINGGFDFWQRGTSFSYPSAGVYSADRMGVFRAAFAAGASASRQATGLTGFQYGIRVQRDSGNTGTGTVRLSYCMDSATSIPLAGQVITFSFYARKGANYTDTVGNLLATGFMGTGTDQAPWNGYTGYSNFIANNAVLTTSWQRFSFTGIVPTNSTQLGFELTYTPVGTAGAADYFEVTGMQLEAGSVATPFSRAGGTLQGELAACQRYYQKSYALATTVPTNAQISGTQGFNNLTAANFAYYGTVVLQSAMRSTPSVTIYSYTSSTTSVVSDSAGTDKAAGSGAAVAGSERAFTVYNNSGGTVTFNGGVMFHYKAEAEL